jgi:5-hydroxyisourate hydrolase-like protein (transthyretin family)
MEDMLMRSPWLVAVAIVAFLAVGCGSPSPQVVSTADAPTPVVVQSPEDRQAATPPPVAPAREAAALLAIDPQPAPQSGQVHISGKGFAAGESVSISVAKTADAGSQTLPLARAVTSSDGAFNSVTLTLPDELQSGPHPVNAAGQTSARESTATLWIRAPQPWLVLDSYDVPQYGDVGLIAGGFEPMEQVQVSLEPGAESRGTSVKLVNLTTDQAGNAAWTQLKLPRLAAGTYSMVLHGQANSAELRREVHVTPLKPTVELSPWAGPPGVPVQFNARGFAPNEQVHVTFGGAQDPAVVHADEYGNLWGAGPVHIPQNAPSGALTLNLIGADSGATATPEFKVLDPKPWLELTSWSGAPGAPVGFGGGGWIASERVTIHVGSATSAVESTGVADDGGWLKGIGQVYISNDAGDDVIFVAVGEQSHLVAAATFKVVFPFGLRPTQSQSPPVPQVKNGG